MRKRACLIIAFLVLLPPLLLLTLLVLLNIDATRVWLLCGWQDRHIRENSEVLVSACRYPVAKFVPGGKYVHIREELSGEQYLIDLETGEQVYWNPQVEMPDYLPTYLAPDLVYLSDKVANIFTGEEYLITTLRWEDPDSEADLIRTMEYLFVLRRPSSKLIAINSAGNGISLLEISLERDGDYETDDGTALFELLEELGMSYTIADGRKLDPLLSPSGRLEFRDGGFLYFVPTNQRTGLAVHANYFMGWLPEDKGIVSRELGGFLIEASFLGRYFAFPMPVIKRYIPQEFWLPGTD